MEKIGLRVEDLKNSPLLNIDAWRRSNRFRREYIVCKELRTRRAENCNGIANGIPLPKFMQSRKYATLHWQNKAPRVNRSIPPGEPFNKADFKHCFILTEEGKADKEVVDSYNAWYNYEPPYEIDDSASVK